MTLQKRTRILSFRVSEGQYQQVEQAAVRDGADSISDYARSVLQQSLGRASDRTAGLMRMDEMAIMLYEIRDQIRSLDSVLRATLELPGEEHCR